MTSKDPGGVGGVGTFTELVGEGGYEGLSLFIIETFDRESEPVSYGFIIPTEMLPAMPPPPTAE